jgi:hypothetical protein
MKYEKMKNNGERMGNAGENGKGEKRGGRCEGKMSNKMGVKWEWGKNGGKWLGNC